MQLANYVLTAIVKTGEVAIPLGFTAGHVTQAQA
jgi:hypothetical protein